MHVLLLALMLQLTSRSLQSLKINPTIFYGMVIVSVAVVAGAAWYFLEQTAVFQLKFTNIRRYVSSYIVILNLVWWAFLIRTRKVDRRILLLSAGIGLQMTGQVINDSLLSIGLEQKSGGAIFNVLGGTIGFFTHLLCLYTWLRAFSPANAKVAPAPAQNLPKLAQ